MNVHLTPELEQLVHSRVSSGRYNSASEVVREALRLLEQRDEVFTLRKEEIRKQIEEGWQSANPASAV
jgi:antitoxin ParD1/3/4